MRQRHTIRVHLNGPFEGPYPEDERIFREEEEFIDIAELDVGGRRDEDGVPMTIICPGDRVDFEITQRVSVVGEGGWLPLFKEILFFHNKEDYDGLYLSKKGIQGYMDYDFEADRFLFNPADNYRKVRNKVSANFLCLNASFSFTVGDQAMPETTIYYLMRFVVAEKRRGFFPRIVSHFNIDPEVKVKPQDLKEEPKQDPPEEPKS